MRRPVAAFLLVLALLLGGAEHVHAGAGDGGACPACQLERAAPVPPSTTVAVAAPPVATFVEPPAPRPSPPPALAPLIVAPKTSPPRA